MTSAVSTDLPPREGTEQSVSTIHGHLGQTGVCFDFYLQSQGSPGILPRQAKKLIPLNHHLGHCYRSPSASHRDTRSLGPASLGTRVCAPHGDLLNDKELPP